MTVYMAVQSTSNEKRILVSIMVGSNLSVNLSRVLLRQYVLPPSRCRQCCLFLRSQKLHPRWIG